MTNDAREKAWKAWEEGFLTSNRHALFDKRTVRKSVFMAALDAYEKAKDEEAKFVEAQDSLPEDRLLSSTK